jgi:hypothetical protein
MAQIDVKRSFQIAVLNAAEERMTTCAALDFAPSEDPNKARAPLQAISSS